MKVYVILNFKNRFKMTFKMTKICPHSHKQPEVHGVIRGTCQKYITLELGVRWLFPYICSPLIVITMLSRMLEHLKEIDEI